MFTYTLKPIINRGGGIFDQKIFSSVLTEGGVFDPVPSGQIRFFVSIFSFASFFTQIRKRRSIFSGGGVTPLKSIYLF